MLNQASDGVSPWRDIVIPLAIVLLGGTIAAFWPWIVSFQRGRRFQHLIRRELREISPYPQEPVTGKPWWEHAQKRFVHEELFRQESITQNRDFLLGLNPTLVYQVSQLWISLEKRDGRQWVYYLEELAGSKRLGSEELRRAYLQWLRIIAAQRKDWRESMGSPSSFRRESVLARVPQLFERRFERYCGLMPLVDYGTEDRPKELTQTERAVLAATLRTWYYEGGGLLLSGRALERFDRVCQALSDENVKSTQIRDEFSRLRTDLKIDLGVRQPQERDVGMAWPDEERW